jgi:hypothetical protein
MTIEECKSRWVALSVTMDGSTHPNTVIRKTTSSPSSSPTLCPAILLHMFHFPTHPPILPYYPQIAHPDTQTKPKHIKNNPDTMRHDIYWFQRREEPAQIAQKRALRPPSRQALRRQQCFSSRRLLILTRGWEERHRRFGFGTFAYGVRTQGEQR